MHFPQKKHCYPKKSACLWPCLALAAELRLLGVRHNRYEAIEALAAG